MSDSIDRWVRRYERPLVAYAARMLGDWAAASDAVQETFLRLCRLTPAGRAELESVDGRVAAWLFSVCRTRVIDMQRLKIPTTADPSDLAVADPSDPPEGPLVRDERAQSLARRIAHLSPRQQEVVRLRFSGGLSYAQIAEVTGMTVSNVGVHLHAAIKNLRRSQIDE